MRDHRSSAATEPPRVPKVQKVELSEKNTKIRAILVIALILVAAIAFAVGVWLSRRTEKGWQKVETGIVKGYVHNDEFSFNYCFGQGEKSATSESKAVSILYNEALTRVYPLFDNYVLYADVHGVCYLNNHVNEEVQVDELLYDALSLLNEKGVRTQYLAPVYETYKSIFACSYDAVAQQYDPYVNEELAQVFEKIAEFAADEKAVSLKLLGNNTVKLFVSDEYLSYGNEMGVTSYIDLWFIQNAFIVDYCADTLIKHGYRLGNISSFDGFTRNLDDGVFEYFYAIYDYTALDTIGAMKYSAPISIVNFRSYPLGFYEADWRFYQYENGVCRTDYLDISDGKDRPSLNELIGYSYSGAGCAEIALSMLPAYVGEKCDFDALHALADQEIFFVCCIEKTVFSNDPDGAFS